ncbi:MAG: PIG-L family deacetylase [Anaerolineae bacterium]|nr:PIG-L family deacetylase [Anaerolineae bacterium]MDW8172794.1 PIG-L family deacetylase [Anaerolineae bacterium]
MAKRLLICYAHPDDESFGSGAMIAKYVAEGVEVYYLCATDGDRGTIPTEMANLYPSVRELRLAELECAARVLGFKQVFALGYKDSGMMNSEHNADPACLWYQYQHCPQDVVRRVVEVMRRVRPHVVLTFNKYGGYGHPDHIAIQRATEQAFHLAGDAQYASSLSPWKPQKLYYGALPTSFLRFLLWMLRLRGKDPRKMGVNQDIDFQAVVDNAEPVHARVKIVGFLKAWDEASACHKSQGGGGTMARFPAWLRRLLYRHQGFTRVVPRPLSDAVDENDLFAGVIAD